MTTEKGVKLDIGKPRLDLVFGGFARALYNVGMVGTFGANKYTDNGWQEVDNGIERYSNALLRHYLNFKAGKEIDEESKLPHLAHLAWNALAILELWVRYKVARGEVINIEDVIKNQGFKGISLMNEKELDEVLDKLL